jgi:hypothetical protein
VSNANVHSLAFVPIRRQTNGGPLEPAMTAEKCVDVTPLPRLRGRQRKRCGFDAAGFPQGNNEVSAMAFSIFLLS